MFFIAGVGSRVKPTGSGDCICPACGRQVSLHTLKKYSVVTFFFVPIIPFGTNYLATCPSCASVMQLDKGKGRSLERDPETRLYPEDLQVVQNNAGPTCLHCGARVSQSQNFCPNCGEQR